MIRVDFNRNTGLREAGYSFFNPMTHARHELEAWDRRHVWHAFTQMSEHEPLLIERGDGCTLFDIDGRAYLDGVSSLWCNLHGHRHPRLDAALLDQAGKIAHTTSLGTSNSTTIRLARRLVELAPSGLAHVFFSDNGASAVEVALKMAFQYWRQCPQPRPEKCGYVALGDAYHGDTLGSVSVGGVARFHAMFAPLLFDVHRLPSPNPYRPPEGVATEELCAHALTELEQLLAREHERIAALVMEPLVQCAAGMIMHPEGYLRGVRALTTKYDVLLIADEVAVGFGRTGRMFACEHEQVTPDFLCLAKGLTAGYLPAAATLTTNRVWEAFLGEHSAGKQFFHGHTYGGNPLACAVALASLDVFDEEQTLAKLPPKISHLRDRLHRLREHPHVGDIRQRGLIAGIELVQDRVTKTPFPAADRRGWKVCHRARDAGVLLRPLGDVLVVMPPLSITIDELDRIVDAIELGMRD